MMVPDLLMNGEERLILLFLGYHPDSLFSSLVTANVFRSQAAGPFLMARSVIWTKAQAGDQSFC